MTMRASALIVAALSLGATHPRALGQTADTGEKATTTATYLPVHSFLSKRDAAADVQAALAEAQRTGKRVIVDVGGDWCVYCQQMDKLFREHPELAELRDKNFLTVAVYYGPENWNHEFLSHYPKVLGVPHFYVLEGDGTVLCSQHVVELRSAGKYDAEKMKAFLQKWTRTEIPPK